MRRWAGHSEPAPGQRQSARRPAARIQRWTAEARVRGGLLSFLMANNSTACKVEPSVCIRSTSAEPLDALNRGSCVIHAQIDAGRSRRNHLEVVDSALLGAHQTRTLRGRSIELKASLGVGLGGCHLGHAAHGIDQRDGDSRGGLAGGAVGDRAGDGVGEADRGKKKQRAEQSRMGEYGRIRRSPPGGCRFRAPVLRSRRGCWLPPAPSSRAWRRNRHR